MPGHLPNRPLSRRGLLARLGALGLSLAAWPGGAGSARAAGRASLLTWRGYDRPDFFQAYRDSHARAPEVTLFDSLEQARNVLRSGRRPDLVHPCYESVAGWREEGWLQGIDTARLSFWGGVFPRLRELPGTREGWRTWFVPFDWGQTAIAYRSDLVSWGDSVESWSLLWDKRYEGRIGLVDLAEDGWWTAAIHAGVAQERLDVSALREVRAALDRQRPLVRLYGHPSELEAALAAGEIVAALVWNDSAQRLRRRNLPVAFADPVEGTLAWCCGLVMHRDAPAVAEAHDLVNAMIAPETGATLIREFGFGHANRLAFDRVGEETLGALGLPLRPMATLERALFVGPQSPEVAARIASDWAAVTGR